MVIVIEALVVVVELNGEGKRAWIGQDFLNIGVVVLWKCCRIGVLVW